MRPRRPDEAVWLSGSQARVAHGEPSTDPQALPASCSAGQAQQTGAGAAGPGVGDPASSRAVPLLNPRSPLWVRSPSSTFGSAREACARPLTAGLEIARVWNFSDCQAGRYSTTLQHEERFRVKRKSTGYHESIVQVAESQLLRNHERAGTGMRGDHPGSARVVDRWRA